MEYIKDGKNYFLRLNRGEEILTTLESFMSEQKIHSAFFNGIGALENATLGFYDLETKTYLKKDFPEEAEVLALSGNLSFKDAKPFAHIHTVLSGKDFQAYGGHLFSAEVSVTLELHLQTFDTKLERKMNDFLGLQLIHCGS